MNRYIFFGLLVFQGLVANSMALPRRLVIALDGISYRDMAALQHGITYTNLLGRVCHRQAFTAAEGYYPVSRMISTFPSTSDVAWTDIFGDRPLPGYQRTYFSQAANHEISLNGLTSTVEHERQMDWQSQNNFVRSMGYIYSVHVFRFELHELMKNFMDSGITNANYYIYIRSSDDAQHMDRDVFSLLATMDADLQSLRARYRAREGRDLQILILSDHGHNHAGRGERVQIVPFLEAAGYRVTDSIQTPQDVVLPTSGIEDWIEIHNAPSVTERLAEQLTHLQGVDVLAARLPQNHFLVLDSKGGRAMIDWDPGNNSFRYSAETGDPLDYLPVVHALARQGRLDAEGFAGADDWLNATFTNHYPMALERIVRGLTCVTLNPATILVSLNNHYVNAGWLVRAGSRLESYGSTHGALDDINSDGIVLSNFAPTHDTASDRVAALYKDFPGLRQYRAVQNGAEWFTRGEEARIRIPRDPVALNYRSLPGHELFLRVWSPGLEDAPPGASLPATIEKLSGPEEDPPDGVANLQPQIAHDLHFNFRELPLFPEAAPFERVYECPPDFVLDPDSAYRLSGHIRAGTADASVFVLEFRTDSHGRPVAF